MFIWVSVVSVSDFFSVQSVGSWLAIGCSNGTGGISIAAMSQSWPFAYKQIRCPGLIDIVSAYRARSDYLLMCAWEHTVLYSASARAQMNIHNPATT